MYDTTRLTRTERRLKLLELALEELSKGLYRQASEESDRADNYRHFWMLEGALKAKGRAAGIREALSGVLDIIKYHEERRLAEYLDLPEDHELTREGA
ncbi:MAG: hypothetical protein EA398_16250 [Deltaproteobacteria bacterium]|nr:MAG: hypothetical protein EA398_16250 [Deltaproteobacteria bacterium]